MKQIIKDKEPNSLGEFRSVNKANIKESKLFEILPSDTKNELRNNLLKEQGFICCYCMNRTRGNNSKIEHFKPLDPHRSEQISYSNLFIACKGGENTPYKHCDTHKGNKPLSAINLSTKIEDNISYSKVGEIKSRNHEINKEINEILNLNCRILKKNRKETIDTLHNNLGDYKLSTLKSTLKDYGTKSNNGRYRPFSQMVVYILNKKIKQKG